MKKITIQLKVTYLTLLTYLEDFISKLSGRKEGIGFDRPLSQQSRQHQNQKLARGIKKLTARIYGADGKLHRWAKRKDVNIFNTIQPPKKTAYEKLEEARILQKTLQNPTDYSRGTEAMVQHNVKEAPRYALERERRVLNKEKFQAIKNNDLIKVKVLDSQIKHLSLQIKGMK